MRFDLRKLLIVFILFPLEVVCFRMLRRGFLVIIPGTGKTLGGYQLFGNLCTL
jgi:hypothetical protein